MDSIFKEKEEKKMEKDEEDSNEKKRIRGVSRQIIATLSGNQFTIYVFLSSEKLLAQEVGQPT